MNHSNASVTVSLCPNTLPSVGHVSCFYYPDYKTQDTRVKQLNVQCKFRFSFIILLLLISLNKNCSLNLRKSCRYRFSDMINTSHYSSGLHIMFNLTLAPIVVPHSLIELKP